MVLKRIGKKIMNTAVEGSTMSRRAAGRMIDDIGDTARVGQRLAGSALNSAGDLSVRAGAAARNAASRGVDTMTDVARQGGNKLYDAAQPLANNARSLKERLVSEGSSRGSALNSRANSFLDEISAEASNMRQRASSGFSAIKQDVAADIGPEATQRLSSRARGYSDIAGGASSKAYREATMQNELYEFKKKRFKTNGTLPQTPGDILATKPQRVATQPIAPQKAVKPQGALPGGGNTGPKPGASRTPFKAMMGNSLTDEQAATNLGGFAAESVSNFLDSGGWGRAAKSAGKGAAVGAVTMGSMSALTGGDFWEGAGKGAVMGGLGGGLRGSIRQSSGAPEGSGTMDSLRHMNQRGNVSESVRTLARSQASAMKSASVLRAGGKKGA